jgi:hypothetical protein
MGGLSAEFKVKVAVHSVNKIIPCLLLLTS